jgi:hypothetical protein
MKCDVSFKEMTMLERPLKAIDSNKTIQDTFKVALDTSLLLEVEQKCAIS